MKRSLLCCLIVAASLGAGTPAWSQTDAEKEALAKVFSLSGKDFTELFSASLLKQVSAQQLADAVKLYESNLGAYLSAVGGSGKYDLLFEKGKAPGRIVLSPSGTIDGLWFGNWTLYDDTPEKLRSAFTALEGTVSVCVVKDGSSAVFELNSGTPLGVGSTFKLYILKALEQRISQGKAHWDDVIKLSADHDSLPTGILQNWPAGSPVTLHTLASLMISISDNTAADHLLFYLGRNAVEAVAPATMRPFYSTLELFKLKWSLDASRQQAFVKASPAEKITLLAGLKSISLESIKFRNEPTLVDSVEWFATTRELCDVISELGFDPILGINPGLAMKDKWHAVSFKGGSEPGVLNYTQLLQKEAGSPVYAVSATINNPTAQVDTQAFTELVVRLMGLIDRGEL